MVLVGANVYARNSQLRFRWVYIPTSYIIISLLFCSLFLTALSLALIKVFSNHHRLQHTWRLLGHLYPQ